MASMPPTSKMMGPPPGSTPQGLTSMVPGAAGPSAPPAPPMPMMGGQPPMGAGPGAGPMPTPPGGGGGLKDVFDEISTVLDSLAGIIPEHAVEIDSIKTQLSEVLAKAISGGAQFSGATGSMEPVRTPQLPA